MVLKTLFIIELTDTEEGGLELVDPSWCPEEGGPPRKKVKSPPAISPTGSSTSIYSGGSSSIDWTTTGTTLEMQGTRVTRTQYGFRTLQESSAKMCLKVTGYPLPEITWYKDDVQLHEDERHTFYADEDGFFAMTIDPVQVEDTGRYTCMATNEYGQASTSAFFRVLKVEKEAAPPRFVNTLKDQECKEGEVISFECEVEGWPEPELVWLVDDQPLRPSHDFKIEYDGMNAKLEIRDAQPDDTGVYCVKIQNEFGTAESKAELTVIPDPDKNHVAPEFQATIEDVECDEGDEVRFKSVITGDPNPDIIWMINGIPLTESEKIRFISEDGICILIIKDVTRHFDGTVTCQGTNRLGTTSCDGRLKVRVPPAPPSFAKPLEDRIVQENAVVSFEVDVLGWPEPKVSFFLKGKELKHGVDGVEIAGADGYYKVIISGCKMDEHDGEIVCRAVNEHGTAESRARLTVEPIEEESRSAPTFIKDIEDQTVKYGVHAVFETTVRGSPNPEVTWFINGVKMDKDTPGVKIEFVNHDHKLTIDSAQYAGTVLCRAENVVGRFETKARLTVIPQEKPKKAPRFSELLSDKSETEGNTVVFEARVEAEPKPEIKWYLKGVELTATENIEIREFDGSVKLELRGIKLEDAGDVKCTATNSEGSAETTSKLTVNRKPFPPTFDKQPQSITVERGSEARFEAHAESSPAPTYQWSIDGRKIRESTEGARVEMIDGTSVLIIDTSVHSLSSTISVVAENSLGADETGARLTVEEKKVEEKTVEVSRAETTTVTAQEGSIEVSQIEMAPSKSVVTEETVKEEFHQETTISGQPAAQVTSTEEVREEMHAATVTGTEVQEPLAKVEEAAKQEAAEEKIEAAKPVTEIPKVTKDLRDQTVVKGEQGKFEVVIEHASEAKWYHNGKELTTTTEGVKITEEAKYEFKLSIDSTIFPSGTVSVKATNESGSAESKCEMKVVEKPELKDKLQDVAATLGEPFKVEVAAAGQPQFKWLINGQTLEDGKDGVRITTEGDKCTLSVDKAEPLHSGKLSVVTTNEAGTVESSCQIAVSAKQTAPQITDGPTNVTVKEKETAEFKVKITGFPEPTVKWSINDKLIEESSTVMTSRIEHEYTLKITETTTTHTGTVKVTAENTVGSDSRTAELKVEPALVAPNFKSQMADTVVKVDEALNMEVALETPQPGTSVKWYNNGKELQQGPGVQISEPQPGTHHLTIEHVKEEMAGTITAKAMNPVGECECVAKITVEKGAKKPEFTKTPQNHEAYLDDESVKFSAIVTGTPTPKITWYLNDKKLENSEQIKVKFEEDTGKTSIRIYKPQISQSGTVRVTAENEAGSVEATATLKVDKKTEVPKFTSNMDDRQVNEGDTVKYTSTVEGYPEPTVEWLLNGEPVSKHPNIIVSDDAGKHTIEIKEITPEQAGELSCQASNSAGMKKQNVTLSVKRVGEAPTFSKNLEDRLVTEGEVTIMEAKLNQVKPKPTVTWLRDGKEFKSDDHFVLTEQEDGTLQLKIITTKMEDKGRITIKAENHFGTAECSASLGVIKPRPMAKPAFQSDIAPIHLTEGDSLQTKLLITGDPTPFVKWYINNQLVCPTEDTEIINVDGVYSLTIHGVTADMTGKIKCVAYNKMGEVTTEGDLKVVAPIPVEFETSLCDATCREGDTLKLKAVLLGEPTPEVSWYVNGKKLEETQNIKIHAEKGTYTVTIKDITCDYSGKVVCEAVNEYGKASSEAMLLVLPRGEPPDFLEWLSNVRARQGSKVVHKVVFTGDPKPTLTWYINNKEITSSSEISIVTDDKTSILTINSFNPELHVGEIICKAENDAGEVSCTANMVTYTSEMFSESESEAQAEEVIADDMTLTDDESLRDELQRTPTPVMAPKFITKIKDSRAKRGHEAIFECVVPDTKGVVCKWLKDGKEIELIARIRVQTRTIEGHTTQELIIEDVRPEDAGTYTVIVENIAGRDVCEATLTVVEQLEKLPDRAPEFIVQLQDKTIKTSDKATFECKVVGEPQPNVVWYHNNKVLEEHAKEVIIESEEGVQRLVITSAEIKHEGKYSCVAENVAGSCRTEATLSVKAPLAPTFTKSLTDHAISIGDQLILFCSVKGWPQPVVEFYHESVRLTSSNRMSIEHDASNTHWRVLIKQSVEEDLGKYRAVAKNAIGAAISEATVFRRSVVPVIEQGLKSTTVKESEEIRMEVKISGTQPEVTWYKDDKLITEDAVHVITRDETTHTYSLVVKQATTTDTGTYMVRASNIAGSVESTAEVTVTTSMEKPTFTKELTSTEVKISETTTLSVTVQGTPAPEVIWKKDGQPVDIDDTHIISKKESEQSYSITIQSARAEDAGRYTCEAKNVAGSTECSANVAVIKTMEAPQFTEMLRPVQIMEKETVKLSVTVAGSTPIKVEWFKDDKPVEIDNVHTIVKDEGSGHYTLTIHDTKVTDVGMYSCKATNVAGEARTEATVHIAKQASAPQFTEYLRPVQVKETETVKLSVTVTGAPQPKVEWFKDDKPVEIDNVHVISKEEGSGQFTLTIQDSKVTDIGKYSCRASNVAGEARTEASVHIAKESSAPQFTEFLTPMKVMEKETVKLSVTVSGVPQPQVSWFKDDKLIEIDNVHTVVKDEGSGHYTLTIHDTKVTDVGKYSCTATNEAGEARTEASVHITKEVAGPQFTEFLKPVRVQEKETVTLSVTVTGVPQPQVSWFKDNQPVEIDNVHVVSKDEGSGHFTLTIHDTKVTDVGKYSCKATNEAGEARTEATVNIAKASAAPQFTEFLRPVQVKETETVELSVTVGGGTPIQVQWFKDDKPVEIDNVHVISKDEGSGHYTLTIHDTKVTDVGRYSCKATNEAGEARTEATVSIAKATNAPQFTEFLQPVQVKEAETVKLSVTVGGATPIKVEWFKDDKPVEIDNVHTIVKDEGSGHYTLTIHDTKVTDVGRYACKATNVSGEARTEANVIITKETAAPQFTEFLQPVQVKETETVKLSVTVGGATPIKVEWFKDDKPVEIDNVHTIVKDEGSGHYTLTIHDTKVTDVGRYACKATNVSGEARTEANVIITKETAAPQFTEFLQPVQVKETETVKLSVTVGGATPIEVEWFKDDKPVEIDNVHTIVKDEGSGHYTLTIHDTKVTDVGRYACKATNVSGEARTEANVIITKESAAPQFTEFLRPVQVKESETVQLSVTVGGGTPIQVEWFKDDKPIEIDNVHIIAKEEGSGQFTLTIKDSKVTDVGRYACKATNIAGTARTETNVLIAKASAAPQFTEFLKPMEVMESETVKLSVTIEGVPQPQVAWFKDDKPIQIDNVHYITKDEGSGHFTLTIKDTKVTDVGRYSCKAVNESGEARTEANILIAKTSTAPQFTDFLRPIEAKETETVQLSVTVTGAPQPKVEWFKDDKPVEIDNVHTIAKDEGSGHFTLTIQDTKVTDVGRYSCRATNAVGIAQTEASVVITKKSVAPEFTEVLRPVEVREKETVNLTVTVTGQPQPQVAWFKDNVAVNVDNVHILTKDDGSGHFTLTIKEARSTDAGVYSARATNESGEARTDATVTVGTKPIAPVFTSELKATEVKETETVRLSVSVEGSPQPQVAWYKDNVKIEVDNVRVSVIEETQGRYTLEIKDARLTDVGNYICKASSAAGEAQTAATMAVVENVEMPQFVEGLKPIEVEEGKPAELTCTVVGKPEPEVVWLRDGVPVQIDGSHVIRKDAEGKHTLIIKDVTASDVGSYTCEAVNKAGKEVSVADVKIPKYAFEKRKSEEVEPLFLEPLQEAFAEEGKTVVLECRVNKESHPEVHWFKDDKPIQPDQHMVVETLDDGKIKLTIHNATKEDIGSYRCEAVNITGTAKTQTKLQYATVVEQKVSEVQPMFLEPLQEAIAEEGKTVVLKCRVNKESQPEIRWFKDDKPVQPDQHMVMETLDDGRIKLTIHNATKEDVGSYRCEAVNIKGTAKTQTKIQYATVVEQKVSEVQPMFLEPLQEAVATEGKTIVLECRVNKESQPEIRWFKDDKPVQPDQHMVMETLDDGRIKLTIHNATKEDVGSYRCEAVNIKGTAQTQTKLQYATTAEQKFAEVEPLFIEPLQEAVATEGKTVVLECKVNKESHPEIRWFKDDKPVQLDQHMVMETLDDGRIKLTIHNATKEDVGSYRCEAVNIAGTAKTQTKLQYAASVQETVVDESAQLGEIAPDTARPAEAVETKAGRGPPEFVELLRSCTVNEKQEAVLKCKVKGEPRPKIKWTKEGKEVEMSTRIRTEFKEDGTLTLTINEVTQQDAGEYRCMAENELGTAWTEGPIIIAAFGAAPQEGEAPDFVMPVRPVVVGEGETAVLEGKVSGKPKPTVKWYKNGELLTASEKVVMESLDDGTQRLTVKGTTVDDTDEYRCEASNEYGDVWSDVTLTVKAKPQEAPSFEKTLVEVAIVEGETATYECKVTGQPQPEIKWFKDKEEISSTDQHFVQTREADGTARLVIKSAKVKDSGEIRCEARNPAGTARTDAPLVVTLPEEEIAPEFARDLTACQVQEGQMAQFECKVKGTPLPVIRWFKDGEELKPGDGIKIEALPDGTNRLTIDKAKIADQGNYRVEATNAAGSMSSKAPLSVQAPQTLKIKKPLQDVTTEKGTKILLSVEVEGKPKTVKWYKGTEQVTTTSTTKVEQVSDVEYKLVVENCEMTDAGAYRVVLSTESESVESSCTVIVNEKVVKVSLPSFKKGLNDQAVPKGQALVLEVEVEGQPKKVKWYKAGNELKDAKTEDLGNGKYRLTVPDFKDSDVGEYSVTAENDVGEVESKAKVTVQVPDDGKGKPQIVSGLVPTTVKQGETATFSVKVKGPVKSVKWYKNGKEVPDAKTTDKGDGTYELTVPNAQKEDAAEYKVVVSNDAGDAESGAALTVKVPQIEVVKGLADITVPQKQTGTLEIEVNKAPKQVKWYKNGKEIAPSDKAQPKMVDDNKYQLVIPDAGKDDTADYKVILTDEDGNTAESSCALTVKLPGPIGIEIVRGLEDTSVAKGEKVVLAVETNATPKQIKWYKNGKELSPSDKAKPEKIADNKYQLAIPDADKEDTADYKVVLTDDDGNNAESSCALTVKLPGKIEIVKGLEDTSVPEGQKAVLAIETSKAPKQIKWYKNGKELSPSDKAKPEKVADTKYQLVIPDTGKDDTAAYKVVLTDDDGTTAESSCALTVKLPGIEIVKGLEDTSVPKGQKVLLAIETSKAPKQIKWYKNGKELSLSDKAKPEKIADNKYQLAIPDAGKDDTADYKVFLTDDDGNNAESSCALTVKLPGIEIVKGLEDTSVPKGQKAVLAIETSRPPKEIKWYKNGKELTPSDKAKPEKVADNKYQLVIPDTGKDDTADYKVVLTDEDGNSADSSCALTVKLPAPIEITKGLEDTTVPQGQKAVLEVESSRPPKQVKWYKNGKELSPSDKPQQKQIGDNKHQLVIPNSNDEDTADYKVILTDDDDNTADSFCSLTVRLPDKEPKIIKGLFDRIVPCGLPTIWEVETENEPRIVKWYKNGKELAGAAAAQVKISKIDDNHYTLEIKKCALEDTGEYKVEVENDAGKAKSSGKLTVEPQLTFLTPLKDQEITEGENAEFQVETNAKPRVVKWYKNGQEITQDARTIITEEETKFKLVIKNATRDDTADFKVVLTNSAGDVDSSAKLTVKKAKPGVPKIIKGLEDQVVAKGASLVFEVKVEGEVEEVRWAKDATPITAGTNAVIEKIDDQTYRLTIPKADLNDAGHYSVEAVNESGKATSDAKGEVDEKPEIVKGLTDTEVSEGDDEVFKVEVSVPVRTVKWYKNGQELKPSIHMEQKKIGPKKYELAINRAQMDDGATYKVVLENAAGECDSSAQLTVKKPNILKMLQGLKDIDVDEGQPIELKVKVEGIPKTVKWYKNGTEITPSADLELKENPETGEYSLLIPQSKKSDGAAYRISLANDKGEIYSGSIAHVKTVKPKDVVKPANFLSPLEDTEVVEGETLTLKCVVAGEPFPEITWTKDGVELEKDERVVMRVALDGTATLRIRDAKKSDFGQYRITAKNEGGTETSSCQVTVKEKGEEPSKPRFIIPLKSTEAEIGEKKEFEVKLRGFPKPTLEWFLNDQPIKFDDRITVEDLGAGNYCLTIKDIRESDFGTLRCRATNELGKDECQAEFARLGVRPGRDKDDDRYPPRFNVPLWDRRIPINDPLSIECHVDAKPTAEIEWFKDGKKLEITESIEIRNTPDGACRVRIARFGREEVGVYQCVATNPLGVADTRSTYTVEVFEQEEIIEKNEYAPRFNPGLQDKTVSAGQSIRLSCTVDAVPKAGIVWYKDGLPLRSGGRFTISASEDGTCTLDISDAVAGDEGAYRCVASNEHGSTNTSCSVTVKVPKAEAKKEGEEPFFTKGLVDIWSDRGETFTMKCAVKGDPFPEIKWYRNGTLVRDTTRTTIETTEEGVCTLTVRECTMSDEGIYRCEAENKYGKAKTQATSHVQISLGKGEAPKLEMGSPPKFVIPLEDQTVLINGIIDLECKVTGQPMPQVKWSKDGGPIWEDSRYQWEIDETKGTYHLRITSATVNDEGTYRCVATNESGSATTKSFVRIDDGLLPAQMPTKSVPPRFTIRLGDARAVEGQPLRLECKVEGSPLPELTWHKDGAQIMPSDRVQITMEPDGTARLVIPQCCMDDEGIYRVIATNPSGSAHDKGNATVKRAPRDADRGAAGPDEFDANKVPRVLEPLENVKVPEKQGFRLRCKFSGEKLAIKWFKDGERVFEYGRLKLIESEEGVCELVVESSSRQDAGCYRCVAENMYGSARTNCEVFVIQKERKPAADLDASLSQGKAPGFTVPLTIRRAKPGEKVTFECVPYGNPFPQIKWLKDGIELSASDKISFESLTDGTQRLHLTDVDFFSEGFFRCVATNEYGTASTKAELRIDVSKYRKRDLFGET
ncbi:hypothetical protein Y032_0256g374 [Ancylostoma ceylanicum]|uniref:Ig-like domain-containing protein n=1 Tax=Ancylostoma ceylanicum TaxID=53326 RepID=A0A016SBU0_9BILA|nr:hypothetical protein Y032_0256g374 [Ancylostoma ceylanicum]